MVEWTSTVRLKQSETFGLAEHYLTFNYQDEFEGRRVISQAGGFGNRIMQDNAG